MIDRQSLKELREDINLYKQLEVLIASVNSLESSVANLSKKIDELGGSHLKIIYWLLMLVALSLAGIKGAEVLKGQAVSLSSKQEIASVKVS